MITPDDKTHMLFHADRRIDPFVSADGPDADLGEVKSSSVPETSYLYSVEPESPLDIEQSVTPHHVPENNDLAPSDQKQPVGTLEDIPIAGSRVVNQQGQPETLKPETPYRFSSKINEDYRDGIEGRPDDAHKNPPEADLRERDTVSKPTRKNPRILLSDRPDSHEGIKEKSDDFCKKSSEGDVKFSKTPIESTWSYYQPLEEEELDSVRKQNHNHVVGKRLKKGIALPAAEPVLPATKIKRNRETIGKSVLLRPPQIEKHPRRNARREKPRELHIGSIRVEVTQESETKTVTSEPPTYIKAKQPVRQRPIRNTSRHIGLGQM